MLAVPVGSTEQHGAHLPLSTDTDIAVELCRRLADHRRDVLVAPPLAYGSSGEHAGFAGTLSIGQAATELLVLELGRSAFDTVAKVLFVSAHGGNAGPVGRAVNQLRRESRDVLLYCPSWQGDPHAGLQETAMMLVIAPEKVDMSRAVRGDTRPMAELLPVLQSAGVLGVTGTGVLGDPRAATAAAGERLLGELTGALLDAVTRWHPGPT